MSDELPKAKDTARSLDERFANRPHTYHRLQQIADQMDEAIANGATADQAEAMATSDRIAVLDRGRLVQVGRQSMADRYGRAGSGCKLHASSGRRR